MGTAPQHDILATQPNQLSKSEAGLHRDQKKRSITAPQPGGRIWNRKQRVDLFPVEKVNRPLFVTLDRKSTRLNSSHTVISYAVFCLKKKKKEIDTLLLKRTLT